MEAANAEQGKSVFEVLFFSISSLYFILNVYMSSNVNTLMPSIVKHFLEINILLMSWKTFEMNV